MKIVIHTNKFVPLCSADLHIIKECIRYFLLIIDIICWLWVLFCDIVCARFLYVFHRFIGVWLWFSPGFFIHRVININKLCKKMRWNKTISSYQRINKHFIHIFTLAIVKFTHSKSPFTPAVSIQHDGW